MRKKDVIEFKIEEMEFGGQSFGYVGEKKVYVKGGITGQTVKAAVKKVNSLKAEAKMMEVLEKSEIETNKVCKDFGKCGGCTILSLEYKKQLKIKEAQLKKLFDDANLSGFEFEGVEASPTCYEYRNKMEYTFGDEVKQGPLTIGLHKKNKAFDIITVDDCYLVDSDFNDILTNTVKYFDESKLSYYRTMPHKGYLRNLVVRKGIKTDEILVNVVTTSQEDVDLTPYKDMLLGLSLKGKMTSILHTINDGLADAVKCDKLNVLYGRDYINEEILGLKFKISPFSFFQTNTIGAEKLYSIGLDLIGDIDNKVMFDLYSGTGTIGQILSRRAKSVVGIEIVKEAVEAAKENAKLNNITNCKFLCGDVREEVGKIKSKPDVIVVDPPRPGIHKDAIRDIVSFGAREILYISCNPKTLVTDLEDFKSRGYEIVKVKGMDMFPNTPHLETLVLMRRK